MGTITSVTKKFKWHCAHRLLNHKGLCNNIHGHTYKMEVTAMGKLKNDGMIVDFGDLKNIITAEIVNNFDHALLIYKEDDDLMGVHDAMLTKTFIFPFNTTVENMVKWIFETLNKASEINDWGLVFTKVVLYETDTSFAECENIKG